MLYATAMSIRHNAHFIYRLSFSWAIFDTTHVTWSINWVSYSSPKSNQCHATQKSSPSKRLAGVFNLVSTSLNNVWCVWGRGGQHQLNNPYFDAVVYTECEHWVYICAVRRVHLGWSRGMPPGNFLKFGSLKWHYPCILTALLSEIQGT